MKATLIVILVLTICVTSAPCQSTHSNTYASRKNDKYIKTIRKIFSDYIKYEVRVGESSESPENKSKMRLALLSLSDTVTSHDLSLLLDVRLYYDPTDFPTRELITPIFNANKVSSQPVIKYRMAHRRKWETKNDSVAFDLRELLETLNK